MYRLILVVAIVPLLDRICFCNPCHSNYVTVIACCMRMVISFLRWMAKHVCHSISCTFPVTCDDYSLVIDILYGFGFIGAVKCILVTILVVGANSSPVFAFHHSCNSTGYVFVYTSTLHVQICMSLLRLKNHGMNMHHPQQVSNIHGTHIHGGFCASIPCIARFHINYPWKQKDNHAQLEDYVK